MPIDLDYYKSHLTTLRQQFALGEDDNDPSVENSLREDDIFLTPSSSPDLYQSTVGFIDSSDPISGKHPCGEESELFYSAQFFESSLQKFEDDLSLGNSKPRVFPRRGSMVRRSSLGYTPPAICEEPNEDSFMSEASTKADLCNYTEVKNDIKSDDVDGMTNNEVKGSNDNFESASQFTIRSTVSEHKMHGSNLIGVQTQLDISCSLGLFQEVQDNLNEIDRISSEFKLICRHDTDLSKDNLNYDDSASIQFNTQHSAPDYDASESFKTDEMREIERRIFQSSMASDFGSSYNNDSTIQFFYPDDNNRLHPSTVMTTKEEKRPEDAKLLQKMSTTKIDASESKDPPRDASMKIPSPSCFDDNYGVECNSSHSTQPLLRIAPLSKFLPNPNIISSIINAHNSCRSGKDEDEIRFISESPFDGDSQKQSSPEQIGLFGNTDDISIIDSKTVDSVSDDELKEKAVADLGISSTIQTSATVSVSTDSSDEENLSQTLSCRENLLIENHRTSQSETSLQDYYSGATFNESEEDLETTTTESLVKIDKLERLPICSIPVSASEAAQVPTQKHVVIYESIADKINKRSLDNDDMDDDCDNSFGMTNKIDDLLRSIGDSGSSSDNSKRNDDDMKACGGIDNLDFPMLASFKGPVEIDRSIAIQSEPIDIDLTKEIDEDSENMMSSKIDAILRNIENSVHQPNQTLYDVCDNVVDETDQYDIKGSPSADSFDNGSTNKEASCLDDTECSETMDSRLESWMKSLQAEGTITSSTSYEQKNENEVLPVPDVDEDVHEAIESQTIEQGSKLNKDADDTAKLLEASLTLDERNYPKLNFQNVDSLNFCRRQSFGSDSTDESSVVSENEDRISPLRSSLIRNHTSSMSEFGSMTFKSTHTDLSEADDSAIFSESDCSDEILAGKLQSQSTVKNNDTKNKHVVFMSHTNSRQYKLQSHGDDFTENNSESIAASELDDVISPLKEAKISKIADHTMSLSAFESAVDFYDHETSVATDSACDSFAEGEFFSPQKNRDIQTIQPISLPSAHLLDLDSSDDDSGSDSSNDMNDEGDRNPGWPRTKSQSSLWDSENLTSSVDKRTSTQSRREMFLNTATQEIDGLNSQDPLAEEVVIPQLPLEPSKSLSLLRPLGSFLNNVSSGLKKSMTTSFRKDSGDDSETLSKSPKDLRMKDLQRLKVLGEGQFGQVWLVSDKQKNAYALKLFAKYDLLQEGEAEMILEEARMHQTVHNHPFIVKLITAFQDDYMIYLLQEFAQGGELFSIIAKYSETHETLSEGDVVGMPEYQAKFYTACIADALRHMHSMKIAYRDLKPENCMLDKCGYPLLIDFGYAKYVPDRTYTFCGTPRFLPPEAIDPDKGGYDCTVDHWSLGVLIYEMLSGGVNPFYTNGMAELELFTAIESDDYQPLNVSTTAADLIGGLLTKDPTKRLGSDPEKGTQEILDHVWLFDMDLPALRTRCITAPWVPPTKDALDTSCFDDWSDIEDRVNQKYPRLTRAQETVFAALPR